jgi:hypothetical protein
MSNDLEKIDGLLQKAPENRASYYQLKYFVLNQPTTQGQLWQCLREIKSRKETMDSLSFDLAESKDRLELLQIEIQEEIEASATVIANPRKQRKEEIKLNILKRREETMVKNINNLTEKLKFVEQEVRFFIQAFEALSKVEELKDFDDFDAQAEYWNSKIAEEINLRIISSQGLSPDLIKTALSLHDGSSVKEETLKLMNKFEQMKMGVNEQVIECRQTI